MFRISAFRKHGYFDPYWVFSPPSVPPPPPTHTLLPPPLLFPWKDFFHYRRVSAKNRAFLLQVFLDLWRIGRKRIFLSMAMLKAMLLILTVILMYITCCYCVFLKTLLARDVLKQFRWRSITKIAEVNAAVFLEVCFSSSASFRSHHHFFAIACICLFVCLSVCLSGNFIMGKPRSEVQSLGGCDAHYMITCFLAFSCLYYSSY